MRNFAFDLYGTLIDVETDENDPKFRAAVERDFFALCKDKCDFWNRYFELCAPPEDDIYYEPDLLDVFNKLANECGAQPEREAIEKFAYRFRVLSRKRLKLFDGVEEMLSALKQRGAKIYLLSNAQACFTAGELKETGLEKYFDGILLSSDAGVKKPSLKFFNMLLDKFGLDREETVYTGNDYFADILGANAANLYSVYITTYDSVPIETVQKAASFVASDYTILKNKLISLIKE